MTALSTRVDDEIVEEMRAVAEDQGCELLHVEFKGGVLRLFLDRPEGGVNLADCESVSKQVSALLDVVDFGDGRYTLEVSSPGLDRQLYGPRDFERFTGRGVRVTYRPPEAATKRTITGRLAAYRPEAGGEIDVVEEQRSETLTIPLDCIQVARLQIEV